MESGVTKRGEVLNSLTQSVLAILELPITSKQIQATVEGTYLKACKRAAGLTIFEEQLATFEEKFYECDDTRNALCSAFWGKEPRLIHFLEGIKGCGLDLESTIREMFFKILSHYIRLLKMGKNFTDIKQICTGHEVDL